MKTVIVGSKQIAGHPTLRMDAPYWVFINSKLPRDIELSRLEECEAVRTSYVKEVQSFRTLKHKYPDLKMPKKLVLRPVLNRKPDPSVVTKINNLLKDTAVRVDWEPQKQSVK